MLGFEVYAETFDTKIFLCRSKGVWTEHSGERVHYRPLYDQAMFWANLVQVFNEGRLDGSDLKKTCSSYLTSLLKSQCP